jgi:hypothetical protein
MAPTGTPAITTLTPARAALLAAAKARRMNLKELSGLLGRNHSYLQQYVQKGSPRELPEDARRALAGLLAVPEEDLRDADRRPRRAAPAIEALNAGSPMRPTHAPLVLVPPAAPRPPAEPAGLRLVREGQNAETEARFSLSDFTADIPHHAVAVALTRPHGMLQPRHVLICDQTEAARLGDLVVSIIGAEVKAVGILIPRATDGTMAVMDGSPEPHPVAADTLWHVLAIRTA